MTHPHSARSHRSGALSTMALLLAMLVAALLPAVASAQDAMARTSYRAFSPALYQDGKLRQFLVKNGRIYRRLETNWDAWEDITHLFNGKHQVGIGEITSLSVSVYQDNRLRMFLTRGGQTWRITQLEGSAWSAWENIESALVGTGTAPITSFTSSLYLSDSLLRQFVVRGGRVYRRTQQLVPPEGEVGARDLPVEPPVYAWTPWTDITDLFAAAGDPQAPVVSFMSAPYADGKLRQFIGRGNRILRRTEPNWDAWDDVTSLFAPPGRSTNPRVHAPMYRRVMVIEINPLITSDGNRPLHEVRNWRNPRELEQQYIDALERASDGVVQYAVAQHAMVRAFPNFTDGPVFGEAEYLACTATRPYNCREQRFDYARILREHQVCEKANAGQIDELWLMGGAYFGFWEANMAGPGAFDTNGPVVAGTTCRVKLNIMGFNYEREPERMLENMGHRVEGTMHHLFNAWRNGYLKRPKPFPANANLLERFTVRGFDHAIAACGNIHGSLNTPEPDPANVWAYDYKNLHMEPNTCEDWENYPVLSGATTVNNCSRWGCTDMGWHLYWLGKIPNFSGRNGAVHHNWWAFVLDWDAARQ